MNKLKKALSYILIIAVLVSAFPVITLADGENIYRISNKYLNFEFNADTGGFSIGTLDGNPQKVLDDNIPLLYAEDKERSNGTSFITVRIGDKDYVFGQDYGFFNIDSSLGTPVVTEDGRLITIPWTIKGITVTLKAALSMDEDTNTTGNVGLSFDVANNSGKDENISVRVLLDTALGSRTDAPYFVIDKDVKATLTETEFSGGNVPSQIRCVDSLTNPSKLSYIMAKGVVREEAEPNKIIIGHWANMANTRYSYTPDKYCDFTNYSNNFRTPDSAAAIYWEGKSVRNGESFTGEMLYGVGNFTNKLQEAVGIDITTGRVELAEDKKSYKNDGIIDVTVQLDNTVDNATVLNKVVLNITVDDEKLEITDGGERSEFFEIGKEVKTLQYKMKAKPQTDLTAGTIYVSVTGEKILADGSAADFETAAQRSVILPPTGTISEIQMNKVNPEIVYISGEKSVTISGKMKPFAALTANDAAWELKLKHETSDHVVTVKKNNIAFLDDSYETLTFKTDEQLEVGYYSIVFEFTDSRLREALKCKSITCGKKLQVSADKKYGQRSYGMIALVRSTGENANTDYDFFTFENEKEYRKFYNGAISATGQIHEGNTIKYKFGEKEESIRDHEIILTVRANLNELEVVNGDDKEKFWQADFSSGDIIINNMLSYEGSKPLRIYEKNGMYKVEGDGLLKVINSINVWRSKWSISVNKGVVHTLDSERLSEALANTNKPVTLSLDGAASMIQSLGGFAVDLKYGELSSERHEDADGTVTYGIGFGGSISLPIKAKEKKSLTEDQEDMSEELNNLFDESLTADQEDISGAMNNLFDENPRRTSTGDKIKKDTKFSEGQLSAEVEDVLFGEKIDEEEYNKNKLVKIKDTGFKGINAAFSLALPKDVLGSLVSNAPGIYASVTINTIENIYEVNAGINIKIIECDGVLAFKQVNVKNKDVIVPDKIEFYVRNGLKIPVAPPVLFIAGLGGGINELADTIGGEFDKLPPITILLFTRLEAIGILTGDFNAKISLEGMSLTGDMKLKPKGLERLLDLKAGINARWIEPWELSLYGNISIIDGLIKGGITVTIADNYFYGYIFAVICIPDSVPFVGGKELAGVEAAASDEFIGANIKILGIRFGVIYYWGDKVSFGKNIDLSAPPRGNAEGMSLMSSEEITSYYGTNIHALSVMRAAPVLLAENANYKEARMEVSDANGQSALLIEIPYSGTGTPKAGEITLVNKDNEIVNTTPDDGNGGGNMLLQSREDGNFIYVTVSGDDAGKIKDGIWTVRYTTKDIMINSFSVNGVDTIPELKSCGISISNKDAKTVETEVNWKIDGASDGRIGTIDVYLTEDKDILTKIKTSKNNGDVLGTNILHLKDAVLNKANTPEKIVLPDSLPNGKYYAVTTLSTTDGISLAISDSPIDFVNPNLPADVKDVKIAYGGNGEIFVSVTDADGADYTHYLAEIVAEDGTALENNIGQFEKGSNFVFGKEAELETGKRYYVNVKTLREEYKKSDEEYKTHYYYGNKSVSSNVITMPEPVMPILKSVKTNFDTSGETINVNKGDIVIEYEFENDVFVELTLNGSRVYAFGNDESKERNYFRKDWKFVLDDLDDGDYVVDFTAYGKELSPKTTYSKDHIKGSQTNVKDAYLGFTVDTSAPVLSLSQKRAASVSSSNMAAIFGANTIIANDDGTYTIEGITEKSANLTIDGTADGITVEGNGSFTAAGRLNDGEVFKTHSLKAVDKAGNVSELMVYVVESGGFSFESIALYLDGAEIPADANGVKIISLKNGSNAKLSAAAVTSDGKKIMLDDELIEWDILYAKNTVSFGNGNISALLKGETAIKAKLGTVETEAEDSTKRSEGLSDYVIVNITGNSKTDLLNKIAEAQSTLANNPNASESKKNALQTAIDEAAKIANNPSATEKDCTDGVTALAEAISAFLKADSGESGGSTSLKKYKITAEKTENGRIELSQTSVNRGNSVTVTAIPDEGYTVADMLINGVSVGRNEVYTIKAVNSDITVKVIFAEKSDLPFDDVIKSDWFYEYVKNAYDSKLMNGTSETKFEPETLLTRAMFVTILHRIDGEKDEGSCEFRDVADDMYYSKAVAWANKNGIVKGISETEFDPDSNITREQIAAILYRYAKYRNIDTSVGENTNILSYEDFASISEYAVPALQYAVGSGLMTGRTETTINPLENASRAEAAAVFARFAEFIK